MRVHINRNGLGYAPITLIAPHAWSKLTTSLSTTKWHSWNPLLRHAQSPQAGYNVIAIDGGWWEGVDTGHAVRNATGYIGVDLVKFP